MQTISRYACADSDGRWDAIAYKHAEGKPTCREPLAGLIGRALTEQLIDNPFAEGQDRIERWHSVTPEAARRIPRTHRHIAYDRTVAVDELGGIYNKPPHILVEFTAADGPFESGLVDRHFAHIRGHREDYIIVDSKRIIVYPADERL